MKMHLVGVFAALCLAAPVASAQSATVRADIPFAFTVGDTQCPAGTWIIQQGQSNPLLHTLRSKDGKHLFMVISGPLVQGKAQDSGKLVFNQHGNEYFLSTIWRSSGASTGFPAGRAERELIAAGSRAQSVPLVLAGTK